MKRYIIPAYIVVDADTEDEANEIASSVQDRANAEYVRENGVGPSLWLDEGLPTHERVLRTDVAMRDGYDGPLDDFDMHSLLDTVPGLEVV